MPRRDRNRRLTRRRFVLGGVAAGGALVAGAYGRFPFGDEFEERVAKVLGIPVDAATALTRRLRERVGDLNYDARAAAFVVATTFPSREVTPGSLRESAMRKLLEPMLADPGEQLIYLGLRPPVDTPACTGLLRPT